MTLFYIIVLAVFLLFFRNVAGQYLSQPLPPGKRLVMQVAMFLVTVAALGLAVLIGRGTP